MNSNMMSGIASGTPPANMMQQQETSGILDLVKQKKIDPAMAKALSGENFVYEQQAIDAELLRQSEQTNQAAGMQIDPRTTVEKIEQVIPQLLGSNTAMGGQGPGIQQRGQMSAQPPQQGIASQPAPNMAGLAGGGIVAFQNGGMPMGPRPSAPSPQNTPMPMGPTQASPIDKEVDAFIQFTKEGRTAVENAAPGTEDRVRANVAATLENFSPEVRMKAMQKMSGGMYGGGIVGYAPGGDVETDLMAEQAPDFYVQNQNAKRVEENQRLDQEYAQQNEELRDLIGREKEDALQGQEEFIGRNSETGAPITRSDAVVMEMQGTGDLIDLTPGRELVERVNARHTKNESAEEGRPTVGAGEWLGRELQSGVLTAAGVGSDMAVSGADFLGDFLGSNGLFYGLGETVDRYLYPLKTATQAWLNQVKEEEDASEGGQTLSKEMVEKGKSLVDDLKNVVNEYVVPYVKDRTSPEQIQRFNDFKDKKLNEGRSLVDTAQDRGGKLLDTAQDRGGELLDTAIDRGRSFAGAAQERGTGFADTAQGFLDTAVDRGSALFNTGSEGGNGETPDVVQYLSSTAPETRYDPETGMPLNADGTPNDELTRDGDGRVIPTVSDTSGDKEGNKVAGGGGKREIDMRRLANAFAGMAGKTSTANAMAGAATSDQIYREQQDAEKSKRDLMQMEINYRENVAKISAFKDVYPKLVDDVENAWVVERERLMKDKGAGFWSSPSDFLTSDEVTKIDEAEMRWKAEELQKLILRAGASQSTFLDPSSVSGTSSGTTSGIPSKSALPGLSAEVQALVDKHLAPAR